MPVNLAAAAARSDGEERADTRREVGPTGYVRSGNVSNVLSFKADHGSVGLYCDRRFVAAAPSAASKFLNSESVEPIIAPTLRPEAPPFPCGWPLPPVYIRLMERRVNRTDSRIIGFVSSPCSSKKAVQKLHDVADLFEIR